MQVYSPLICSFTDFPSINMVIILGMMQVSKKIPFEDPNVLMGVRVAYVVSNIIIAGLYLYLQMKINAKKGEHASSEPAICQGPPDACLFVLTTSPTHKI